MSFVRKLVGGTLLGAYCLLFPGGSADSYDGVKTDETAEISWYQEEVEYTHHVSGDTFSISPRGLIHDDSVRSNTSWKAYDALSCAQRKYVLDTQHVQGMREGESVEDLPAPVRATKTLQRIDEWVGRTGLDSLLGRRTARHTLGAIAMSESFFDHRAINQHRTGDDLGLFQASRWARNQRVGGTDFSRWANSDWYEVERSVEFGAKFFRRLLDDAESDLSTAIMSYNTGLRSARNGSAQAKRYLEMVRDRRKRYFEDPVSPTWRYVLESSGWRERGRLRVSACAVSSPRVSLFSSFDGVGYSREE